MDTSLGDVKGEHCVEIADDHVTFYGNISYEGRVQIWAMWSGYKAYLVNTDVIWPLGSYSFTF